MQKLNPNSRTIIAINTIHSVIDLFINTFLVAYFLHLTGNDAIPACLFYIFNYTLVGIGFILLGNIVKCGNKLFIYRISFIANALLLFAVIYLKEDTAKFIWILGFISGLEKAMFFAPQNLIISQEISKLAMLRFNGYREAFAAFAKIIMPFVLGWFISVDSFINTTIFILFLTLVEFILSFRLTHLKIYNRPFKLKLLTALALKRRKLKMPLIIDFFNGFIFSVLDVLVVLYIVYIFKTNMNLGILTSVFAVVLTLTNWIFGRFCRRAPVYLLTICGITGFLASVYFVFDTSKLSFIIYNIVFNSSLQLIRIVITCLVFRVSQDKSVASLYRFEYLALREFFLNCGRCLGFIGVILTVLSGTSEAVKYFILALSLMIIALSFITAKTSQNLFERKPR